MPPTSYRFHELSAAKSWGLTPSQFDGLPIHERAEMLAHVALEDVREAYSLEKGTKADKKNNQSSQSTGSKEDDPRFLAMKRRAGLI